MKPAWHKIWLAGFGSALALLAGIAAVNWSHLGYMEETAETVARSEKARTELRGLLLAVVDIETGQRGYLLTGDPAFLQPLEEGLQRLPQQQQLLESLLIAPEQKAALAALKPVIAERIAIAQATVRTRQLSGMEKAVEEVRSLKGKQLTDQIRDLTARMNRRGEALLEERTANARRAAQSVRAFTLGGTAASFVLLSTVFALLLRQNRLRQEAEVQRDDFFNFAIDLFCIAGADGYFRQVNPAFSETLGWTAREMLARPFLDFVHPDDRDATLAEMQNLTAGQPTLRFENRYLCKDGSCKTLAWRATPRPDGIIYAAARDMTEIKAAADALSASEERLAVTLDSIGDAVLATDTQGHITQLNPIAEKLTGWTQEEALGRHVAEVFHIISEETRLPAVIPVDDVLATGKIHGLANHTAIISRDGTERSIADSAAPIHDRAGRVIGVVLVFRDVTEEYAVHRALRDSDALNRSVLNSMMANIAVVDRDGTIIAINKGWEQFALENGADAELSAVGVGANYLDVCERAARDMGGEGQVILDGLRDVLAHPGVVFKHEYPCHSPTENRWFVMHVSHLSGGQGGAVISQIDITARKETEQRIERLNSELLSRAAQVEAANRELESFSYSVSHDLRAPLRHINGYVGMLRNATEGRLPDTAARYLNVIATASEEMGRLIDDLLAFSRMSRAGMREVAVDLDQLVKQTIQGLELATAGRNIIWKIAPLPPGMGDPAMLKQVFSNLIDNAVKYTRQRDPAEIEIGCAGEENNRTIYFVRDNGAGFDMRYAHKLFGVFQRLHRAEEFEGTGIGLATARRVLLRHGERIWAEGEVEKGATFYFTLKPANNQETTPS